jgi:hypothetical protein
MHATFESNQVQTKLTLLGYSKEDSDNLLQIYTILKNHKGMIMVQTIGDNKVQGEVIL